MSKTTIRGIKSGHQMITPTCRSNRGVMAAFMEAQKRLQETYFGYATDTANAGVTWHLVLVREGPEDNDA